jgi:hypothetical protein
MSTVDVLWVIALAFPDGGGVFHHCTTDAAFSSNGKMLLTVHVQVDLAKRRRERTGSYPVQLVHFVVI